MAKNSKEKKAEELPSHQQTSISVDGKMRDRKKNPIAFDSKLFVYRTQHPINKNDEGKMPRPSVIKPGPS